MYIKTALLIGIGIGVLMSHLYWEWSRFIDDVCGNYVVETLDTLRLLVVAVGRVYDVSIP